MTSVVICGALGRMGGTVARLVHEAPDLDLVGGIDIRKGEIYGAPVASAAEIDELLTVPFGPGDEERLIDLLGTGEVAATIEALGPTQVQGTAIPGVWLLDYRNVEGERLALHLEIAAVPQILRTQSEDLDSSIAALDARLQLGQGDPRLRS
jgi:hypothetical protein